MRTTGSSPGAAPAEPTPLPGRPVISAMRPMLIVFACLAFLATLSLYVGAAHTERFSAWTIRPPLSAAFLGAGYAAGFVLAVSALRARLWAYARIALVAAFTFATLTLIVTLLHLDRFHFDATPVVARTTAWAWLVVYLVFPVWTAVLIVLQECRPGPDPAVARPLRPWFALALGLQGGVLVVAGAALLATHSWTMSRWPWELTPLTSRAVGAWLVAYGVAAFAGILERDLLRIRPAAATFVALGVMQLLALARFAGDVRWEEPAAWAYVLLLCALTATGLYARLSPAAAALGTDAARAAEPDAASVPSSPARRA
jgi:hypothetical protein